MIGRAIERVHRHWLIINTIAVDEGKQVFEQPMLLHLTKNPTFSRSILSIPPWGQVRKTALGGLSEIYSIGLAC